MERQPVKPEFTFKMFEILGGLWLTGCVKTAAELNIADLLASGPMTISKLAEETQSHEIQLYRVMRALSGAGIFEESENRTFILNDFGAALQSNVPGTAKNFVLTIMNEHFPGYGDLTYAVQTGKIPFEHIHGKDLWEYYKEYPEIGENFGKGMTGMSGMELKGIIENYDFKPYQKIVDIGGGNGVMIHTILNSTPDSFGIIFDEANVIEKTVKMIPENLKERCSVAIGSFFDRVPEGADLYTMKWIIHDWSDDECVQILKNCYNAMPRGAKLLIIDAVIPDDSLNKPHMAKLLDIVMLACLTGKERTLSEFKMIIEKAGLQFNRVVDIGTEAKSIIECEKL
ncbi:methyltransferase [Chryseobacterium sediminis]|uniref:SAM-dependent methyltransferase n=1 Tax=Chryseobacterium sediminis TaxID=1679494 RepID=A0A5B2UAD4_9FLAO|nr:methyltransferase [Chryseobacterium sediminis]KAA2223509.1 SAM-dependent methyltransferase [Chryseobacterium sediminis]